MGVPIDHWYAGCPPKASGAPKGQTWTTVTETLTRWQGGRITHSTATDALSGEVDPAKTVDWGYIVPPLIRAPALNPLFPALATLPEPPPHPSGHQPAWGDLSVASKYGIAGYRTLKNRKPGSKLEVHHLLEKRFAVILGVRPSIMLSVVVTRPEHNKFTQAWRTAIPYFPKGGYRRAGVTRENVYAVWLDRCMQIVQQFFLRWDSGELQIRFPWTALRISRKRGFLGARSNFWAGGVVSDLW